MAKDTNKELISLLNDLLQLDHDAILAYEAAIERLEDPTCQAKLGEFMSDHQRHTRELSERIQLLGGTPKDKPDAKQILTKGKVMLANLSGDEAILKAMRSNEDQTNAMYEKAVRRKDLHQTGDIRSVLERNLGDERRHRAWIVQEIERRQQQHV